MNSGMMWFDNDKTASLAVKLDRAVDYYRQKYGRMPNLCLVHPSAVGELAVEGPITVRPYRPVLPGHLWIGVEDAAQGMERASADLVKRVIEAVEKL